MAPNNLEKWKLTMQPENIPVKMGWPDCKSDLSDGHNGKALCNHIYFGSL